MKLVLCEDHLLLLQALATALSYRGHVIEAITTTPEEAVRAVERHDPDVLLTDLWFPDGSGLDAARQVKSRHPRTKVVILTGTDAPEHLAEALEIGVSGYLLKGQRIEEISAAVDVATLGGFTVHPSLLRQLRIGASVPRQRTAGADLTDRERTVLDMLARGLETHQIVRQLDVSESTVRTHVQNILGKLGVHSRVQAVLAYDEFLGALGGTSGADVG